MSTTKSNIELEPLNIVEDAVEQLSGIGRTDIAEQMRVFASTLASDTISVGDAAKLANVSPATIKNWIGRGIVLSKQVGKGKRHLVDRASLAHAIDRRAKVDEARKAFTSPADALAYLSGLDKETIERLGGM